jgi:hypothetical protein
MHQAIRVPDAPAPPAEPGPGQVRCPQCGEITDATRRFCRRGHPIRDLTPEPVAEPSPTAAASGERQGALHHAKVAYDKGISLRAQVFRFGLILGALGIGVSMLPPWGFHVREFAGDQLGKLIPDEYEAVAVTARPGLADLRGFPSRFAVDGQPSRSWAVPWDAKAAVPTTCGAQSGASGVLELRLPAGTTIDRLTVRNGLPDDDPNVGKYATPKAIDVIVPQGPCTRIQLDADPAPQHHSLHLAGAKQAVVQVASVYPAEAGPSTVVALSELQFEKKK